MDVNVASMFLVPRCHVTMRAGAADREDSSGTPFRGVPFLHAT
jgi:hypothetical protein